MVKKKKIKGIITTFTIQEAYFKLKMNLDSISMKTWKQICFIFEYVAEVSRSYSKYLSIPVKLTQNCNSS